MSLGPLCVLLAEVSVQVLCPFFNWLVIFLVWSCMRSLYILEIKPLSNVSLANIFSHTVASFFILLLSLAMQKLFILMKSHLFILSYILTKIKINSSNLFYVIVYGVSYWMFHVFLKCVSWCCWLFYKCKLYSFGIGAIQIFYTLADFLFSGLLIAERGMLNLTNIIDLSISASSSQFSFHVWWYLCFMHMRLLYFG